MGLVSIAVLHMRKLRHRDSKKAAQDHIVAGGTQIRPRQSVSVLLSTYSPKHLQNNNNGNNYHLKHI